MTRIIASLLLAVLLPFAASAQEPVAKSQYEVNRQLVETERQAIVAANLPLTEAEADQFWPVYRAYRNAVADLDGKAFDLIMDYAKLYNAGTLSDEEGVRLMETSLQLNKKRLS